MDTQNLKRVFDAARRLRGHNLEEAAQEVGKSVSMIRQTLAGTATSKPTTYEVMKYCRKAGLQSVMKDLGLDVKKKMTEPV